MDEQSTSREEELSELIRNLDLGSLDKRAWHYTNSEGLLGILNSSCFHASSPRFVNDYFEMTFGLRKFQEYWQGGSAFDGIDDYVKKFIDISLGDSRFEEQIDKLYFLSASKSGDNLNQWMHYSGSDGFAIEIKTSVNLHHIPEMLEDKTDNGRTGLIFSDWYDVNYSENDLIKSFLNIIKSAEKFYNSKYFADEKSKIDFFQTVLMSYFLKYKHNGFHEEKEIRYVVATTDEISPKYLSHSGYIKPYLSLYNAETYVDIDNPGLLPISGIVCGPEMRKNELKMIDEMLKSFGYSNVSISKSEIPYKNGR